MPTLEVIKLDNIQKIKYLGCQTYLPHYLHLWHEGGVEWYLNKCFSEQQIEADLANPSLSYYAICWQGKEVGLLKLVKNQAPLNMTSETSLYLEKIYFLKEATGLGLGQLTMQWVFEQARQWGFEQVWLMAMDSSHKAISSYEKAGFKPTGRTCLDEDEFFRLKAELRGMVILQKSLR